MHRVREVGTKGGPPFCSAFSCSWGEVGTEVTPKGLPPFSPHSTFTFALSCHKCARSLPVLPFSHPFFHTILFSSCPSPSVCPPSFHQSLPPFRFPSISCRSHWSFIFRSCQELACAPFMLYPLLHPKSKCPRNTMAMRCSCMLYSTCCVVVYVDPRTPA